MNFSIVKNKKYIFLFTALVIVAGIVTFCINGFNWDIEFVGGTELSYDLSKTIDKTDEANVEKIVVDIIGKDNFSSIRIVGDNKDTIVIRTKLVDKEDEKVSELREQITAKISEDYEGAVWQSTDTVSAEVSAGLKRSAILAVSVAIVLMLVYIAFRFEVSSAFAAVLCLAHDVFVMLFAYSLLQIPMGSTVIATVLTILGYSINATIIIFDRIRENVKQMPGKSFGEKVDLGIKSTLTRSINTTITTLITITLIYFMGVTSIKNFALPIIVGIVAGFYSSVCLSGCLWDTFRKKNKR